MRKLLLSLALLFVGTLGIIAQNVQLHYDFGHLDKDKKSRPALTTTVEMFRPDKWGNTFFFIDMDYKDHGVEAAYWEIARELKFWKAPIAAHLEYNGGTSKHGSYNDAYLIGPSYSWNNKDFSTGFTFMAMYKYLANVKKRNSFQLTATWYHNMCGGLLTTSGFADFWNDCDAEGQYPVFMTEPQLWLNFNKLRGVDPNFNLSLGTEWEFSYNFPYRNKTFSWNPTLALKWTF